MTAPRALTNNERAAPLFPSRRRKPAVAQPPTSISIAHPKGIGSASADADSNSRKVRKDAKLTKKNPFHFCLRDLRVFVIFAQSLFSVFLRLSASPRLRVAFSIIFQKSHPLQF